jgi:rubrerythrin
MNKTPLGEKLKPYVLYGQEDIPQWFECRDCSYLLLSDVLPNPCPDCGQRKWNLADNKIWICFKCGHHQRTSGHGCNKCGWEKMYGKKGGYRKFYKDKMIRNYEDK